MVGRLGGNGNVGALFGAVGGGGSSSSASMMGTGPSAASSVAGLGGFSSFSGTTLSGLVGSAVPPSTLRGGWVLVGGGATAGAWVGTRLVIVVINCWSACVWLSVRGTNGDPGHGCCKASAMS